jgi:integrase
MICCGFGKSGGGMKEWKEYACTRCGGTGMVCGHKPEILPGACCVDFANAICPECGGTGKNPVPKWYIQRLLKKACQKASVGPYRLHDFRHTFNTNMTKAGVDQVITMKLTGHKTYEMFLRYSHLDKAQSEEARKWI